MKLRLLLIALLVSFSAFGQSGKFVNGETIKGDVKSLFEQDFDLYDLSGLDEFEKDVRNILYNKSRNIAFNEEGNLVEIISYNSDGSIDSKNTYKYDEEGNLNLKEIQYFWGSIEEASYLPNSSYEYEYDNKGNWTSRISLEEGLATGITWREIEYYD